MRPIVQCTTIFFKKFSCDFIWGLPLKFDTDVIINVNSGHLILKIHIWCSYFSPFFFLDCRKCGILKFFLEKRGMGLVWEVLILLDVITVQCSECTLNQLCIFSLILAFKLIFVWLVPEKLYYLKIYSQWHNKNGHLLKLINNLLLFLNYPAF